MMPPLDVDGATREELVVPAGSKGSSGRNDRSSEDRLVTSVEEIQEFAARIRKKLTGDEAEQLDNLIFSLVYFLQLLAKSRMSIRRLRGMIFGGKSEKSSKVMKTDGEATDSTSSNDEHAGSDESPHPDGQDQPPEDRKAKRKKPGHGRNAGDKHTGATDVDVACEDLTPGGICPSCQDGKVYLFKPDGVQLHFVGQPPIRVTRYRLQRFRCRLCDRLFTADLPEEARGSKYDETVVSTLAMLKFDAFLPWYRQERFLRSFGILLSDSTISDLVAKAAAELLVVFQFLFSLAARSELVTIDDTWNRILLGAGEPIPGRTGIHTTGIAARDGPHEIILYLTGANHAGENLSELLAKRPEDLPLVIRMADSLSRNNPKEAVALLAKCLTHGRRKFVEIFDLFPKSCRFVIQTIADVYRVDRFTKYKRMSPEQRLDFHQRWSGPRMERLKIWLQDQLDQRQVEDNSSLGEAIQYMLNHWDGLTMFLKVAGAPLDTNIVENALRRIVLIRRNSLFYRTQNGADVGDIFTSLIATCRANAVDPFEYLTALLRNLPQVKRDPASWLPWKFETSLAAA
jgi:transposase